MKKPKKAATPPGPRMAGQPDRELGRRIKLRRVEQRLTQAELGTKLGVTFQQVQKYEKGMNRVGASRLQQIARALDVPITFFYSETPNDGDGVDSLLNLDPKYSIRMLRAYSAIKDRDVRRNFVRMMEIVAGHSGEE